MRRQITSVIICAHNEERFIGQAVRSALRQSYVWTEVIVVNDASTDRTADAVREAASHRFGVRAGSSYLGRVKLISLKERVGLAKAREIGLEHARGEWITFLDADDWLSHRAIERAIFAAERHNADIAQMVMTLRISRLNLPISWNQRYHTDRALDAVIADQDLFPVHMCGKIFKRELLKPRDIEIRTFWGEDRLRLLPILADNPSVIVVKSAIYNYRYPLSKTRFMPRIFISEARKTLINSRKTETLASIQIVADTKIDWLRSHNMLTPEREQAIKAEAEKLQTYLKKI